MIYSKAGGLIYFTIFRTKFMVINDPKIAFELLDKRSTLYSDRPKSVMIDLSVSFLIELERCRWKYTPGLAGDLTWHSTTTEPNGKSTVALCIKISTIELFANGVDFNKTPRQNFWSYWKRIRTTGFTVLNSKTFFHQISKNFIVLTYVFSLLYLLSLTGAAIMKLWVIQHLLYFSIPWCFYTLPD